ncbi:MAG TPA: class I SAM-dependent methyltransferase [Clostridia bacterium]|nr:class I SAM-dependent methyltransferase [Clostridia bacterium]
MEFYTALGRYYDQVFPLGEAQLAFLTKYMDKPGPVADLACGTGTYAQALAERGYRVVAVDLDGEMARQAVEKTQGLPVKVLQGDMREAAVLLKDEAPYTGVFCIGNSIVHLNSHREIAALCRDVYGLLKPGGVFIIQIVNYDWVLQEGVTELPTIKREEVTFARKYLYRRPGEPIEFRGELTFCQDGRSETVVNSVTLLPLLAGELEKMLREAGFNAVDLFGGFHEVPHSVKTPATVVLARK